MKIGLAVVILALPWAVLLHSRQKQNTAATQRVSCEDVSHALASGEYVYAAMSHIWPSSFGRSQGITIAVEIRPAVKLLLHTAGGRFQLWTDTVDVPGTDVWKFLESKAESCTLPPDPADVAKLLKTSWEARELSQAQFERLHRDFMSALSAYVSRVEERSSYIMATDAQAIYLDAHYYPIVYDNTYEHFQIKAWDVRIDDQTDKMVEWVHELQKFAGESFHRSLGHVAAP